MIKVEIVADSINQQNNRLTSMILTYPRIIHAEVMTHRMFSRNASSSRAVPVKKMIEAVKNNIFCPFEFQKTHKGMQGSEYFIDQDKEECKQLWLESAELVLQQAQKMDKKGISKQIINRILEPFMWYTVIITSGKEGLDNFFNLRCPQYKGRIYQEDGMEDFVGTKTYFNSKKEYLQNVEAISNFKTDLEWLQINKGQAEIHMMALAEAMYDAINESTPKLLKENEYHIPYEDNIQMSILDQHDLAYKFPDIKSLEDVKIRIAVSRCARVSYTTVGEEGKYNYENDIKLYDKLLQSGHFSPFEHIARCMTEKEYSLWTNGKLESYEGFYGEEKLKNNDYTEGWCNNFRGFIQYRKLLELN